MPATLSGDAAAVTTGPAAGFMVIHGNRLEDLRDLTIDFLKAHPMPPLVPELFLVQSNGMKHWLEQALAHDAALGICAATRIELPGSFLWEAYRAVLGREAVPEQLPFDKDALTWRLLRLLPKLAPTDASYEPLRRYLEDDGDARRSYQLAQQVADVFDGYQQYRADWLESWAQGEDDAVPAPQAWQPRLWRALLADVGGPRGQSSRAAVHAAFLQAMQRRRDNAERPAAIPPRIVIFGISALPLQTVHALAELGRICQVLMVVQNPCQFHWSHVVEDRHLLRTLSRQRQQPKSAGEFQSDSHALLASWGRQGRDYLHLLDEFDQTETQRHLLPRADVFTDPLALTAAPTRLNRLQSGILNLEPAPRSPVPVAADGSIEFSMAHSAQREVEVLHDRLLAWLDADPQLQPRDIMVMVPDMTTFASHVQAVFGRFARGQPRHLPYSVADTSARQLPLVQALERLLHLPESRISFADWLAAFEVAAVRRRFGLTEADVADLRGWLEAAGVRWGLDTAHRESWGFPAGIDGIEQNSWASGLRRLLLGYANPSDTPWQDVLPVKGVAGLGAQRIGALADWLNAMEATLQKLRQPQTPVQWVDTLNALLEQFFDPADDADERLLHRLRELLLNWQQRCDAADLIEALPLVIVREHWLAQIESPGLQQRFFGGGVQFATLLPMRSIPFKVVCLLGMNDADYPRRSDPRDFDLMQSSWRAGDRSRREDDRYLFLEALLSARERLYISWQGRRATDNAELPPSVVVAQLQEELRRRFTPLAAPQLQPLQPFSNQYFEANSAFVTYDADWQRSEDDALKARVPGAGIAALACPETLKLADLQRLLRQPVEIFWRSRLRVNLDEPDDAVEEDEPFELDALQEHQAGVALIEALQRHGEAAALLQQRLAGRLPLAAQGQRLQERLLDSARRVCARAAPWLKDHQLRAQPVALDLVIDGLRLDDAVPGLYSKGGALLQLVLRPGATTHTRDHVEIPRHHALVKPWVTQVCLAAAGHEVTTVVCAADDFQQLPALTQQHALQILTDWVQVWREAWTRPLPLACKTAFDYLTPNRGDHQAARKAFEGEYRRDGEQAQSPYLLRSFTSYEDIHAGLEEWAARLYAELITQASGTQPP